MAELKPRWPPKKIEAMRRELLEGNKTLQQLADREGVSKQLISSKVGPLNRGHSRRDANARRIKSLFEADKSDEEIASVMRLSVATVQSYRQKLSLIRRRTLNQKAVDHAIWCAQEWRRQYGYTPAVADWNPSLARRIGHPERAERFEKFRQQYDCTPASTIMNWLTWSQFIRQTGLPPAPVGGQGVVFWKNRPAA